MILLSGAPDDRKTPFIGGGQPITVKDARDYVQRYLTRITLLDYLTQGKTGLGRIATDIESLGWRFDAKAFKAFVNSIDDSHEVVILFGVDPTTTPATHVIITDGQNLPTIGLHLPAFSAADDDTFGYEYGSSCCNNIAIDKCFQNLTQKITTEEIAKAIS